MPDEITFRPVGRDEWPEAMTLAARSFLGEPFLIEMFGEEPVRRFALAHRFYRASEWVDEEVPLGAFIDGVQVGLCLSSPFGRCSVCRHIDPDRPPVDPAEHDNWVFEVNVQAAHRDQGGHAWLRRIVVDPALRSAGIGSSLVARMLDQMRADGCPVVLLECQPHRERLYAAAGFRRVRSFPDPLGPDALLMRIDL